MNCLQNSSNTREGVKVLNLRKNIVEKNIKTKKKTTANVILNSERLHAFPVILGKRKISTNTTSL